MVADGVDEEETAANSIEGAGAGGEEEVRCIKKVMQVRDFLQDVLRILKSVILINQLRHFQIILIRLRRQFGKTGCDVSTGL